jgi:hypothetical protein
MEKNVKIVFRNEDAESIFLTFEPEGLVMPLPSMEQVDFDLDSEGTPFRIEYKKYEGKTYVIFWEEEGCRYEPDIKGRPSLSMCATESDGSRA